jgi:hypothetical protein
MFEGKGQMALECRVRGVARRQDAPAFPIDDAVALPDRGERPGQGDGQIVCADQGGIARGRRFLGKTSFLKNRHWP